MNQYYQNILDQLKPYSNKVFFHALSEPEIHEMESQIGKQFPDYFNQFLLTFGIKQDLVFELMHREQDFVNAYNYLPDKYKKKYMPIGDNGGEDIWLINSAKPSDKKIYEWQHWSSGEVVPLGFTFPELLVKSIDNIKNTHGSIIENQKKAWHVQFSIKTNDESLLLKTINAIKTQDWTNTTVSPAGVICSESEIQLLSQRFKFKRQEYQDWKYPSYYFNLKEPVDQIGADSKIRELDRKLKRVFMSYKLIDYGILPDNLGDE